MSNRNKDANYRQLAQMLAFHFEQSAKLLNTAIPGFIDLYDPDEQVARVQIAIDLLCTDGTRIQKSPLIKVPVLWPAGSGGMLHIELEKNDPVWIMFSQRGIENFKNEYKGTNPQTTLPSVDSLMDVRDAVLWAGFTRKVPAVSRGVCLQSNDGETYISIVNGRITIKGEVDILAPNDTARFR